MTPRNPRDDRGATTGRPESGDVRFGGAAFPFAPRGSAPILVPGLGDGAVPPASDHPAPFASAFAPAAGESTLADHFLACCRLGRYLTVAAGGRFVITDDFRMTSAAPPADAAAMASIYSRDFLVAESALLPLGRTAGALSGRERAKYERLFDLIESHALAPAVKSSAHAMLERDFSLIDVRAIEGELELRLFPARNRYREFLAVVARLIQGEVAARDFVQEFVDFTRTVAGRLDFGIYSFCIDRIFVNARIPQGVKRVLATEIIKYPPLVRRELITNILVLPGLTPEMVAFVRKLLADRLDRAQLIEIELLEAVKFSRLSMGEIEQRLRREVRPA
jgi:hypothetical protein